MDSITKTKLSNNQIEAICKNAFGNNIEISSIEELSDGYFNTAYSLSFNDNFKTILKIAPNKSVKLMRYEKNIMQAEIEVLNLIKNNTEVPVPKVYDYNTKLDIIENEYFFMEYINGISLYKCKNSLPTENIQKIYTQLGIYTKEINSIFGGEFGYISQENFKYMTWYESFYKLIDDVLLDGIDANIELPISYNELYDIVNSKKDLLNKVTEPRLIHKDLWSGNIFVNVDNSKITGIIDCERAIWGDPLMEFVFGFTEDNAAFNIGYNRHKASTPEELSLKALYKLYLNLILIVEQYYRFYPDNRLELKARNAIGDDLKLLR